jgi:integrase
MSYASKRQHPNGSWKLRVVVHGRDHYRTVRGHEAYAAAALEAFRAEFAAVPPAPVPSAPGNESFVYVVGERDGAAVKIGRAKNLHKRRSHLQIGNAARLEVLWSYAGDHRLIRWLETRAHELLREHSIGGEWFGVTAAHAQSVITAAVTEAPAEPPQPAPRPAPIDRMAYGDKRPRGLGWELRVVIAGRAYYRTMHGSEAQADVALTAFRAELSDHGGAAALPSTRFETWAATFMELRPELAAQTRQSYRRILTRHVLPAIGKRQLGRITTADAIELQRKLLSSGLAPVTVGGAIRLATDILADAVRARIITANPFACVRHVKGRETQRDVLAPERFALLHRLSDGDTADIIRLGLASGMRRGELLALRWQDVADDGSSVAVTGSIEIGDDKRPTRKEPKTRAGRRTVTLPPQASEILRRRRLAARQSALASGRDWRLLPVFPASNGWGWAYPSQIGRACALALHRLGIEDSLHGLRHAHATALLSDGANPRAVQARLGHANIRTTIGVYGHALPREDESAAAAIARLMGAA